MQIEMVDTIRGPIPRVALERREIVVQDDEDRRTVQINWHMADTGEIVRQDGHVHVKRPLIGIPAAGLASVGG